MEAVEEIQVESKNNKEKEDDNIIFQEAKQI